MSRLRISGKIIASCFTCCAAAVLMIGLTALNHRDAGGLKHDMPVSNPSHAQLLQPHAAPVSGISAAKSLRVTEQFNQFPLSFEPNQQQTNSEVKFLARGSGYILFLTEKDVVFTLGKTPQTAAVLRMSLLGANASPSFTGMEELPGKSNYFIGDQPAHWHTNIPNYRKVAERGIYPGIDLVYYGTQRQLEYDYVIAPGASPSKIQIAFEGAKNLHTDAQGDLVLSVAATNDVRLHKPIAYQQIGDEKQLVAANYVLQDNGSVEFGVGAYDTSRPLVVDPILAYSTYLGGSGIDNATSIAIAPDNTAFVAGSTFSTDFPTVHALQANDGGGPDFPQDAFVSKISSDGSTLLYSTFLGGENQDAANGIAVDNFGDAFVTGFTLSPHFPVSTGAFDTLCGFDGDCGATFSGGSLVTNAFVTELNPAGSALVYSTFFGYFENVKGQAIAVDSNGNAYITGSTSANGVPVIVITPPKQPPPPFPITSGAFQPGFGGGSTNAFIAKFDATGTTVLYSSYLGGDTEDVGHGVALDSNANVYLTGLTYSTNFPRAAALQTTPGGAGDAFAAKVNTNGSSLTSLVYSTYLGGSGLDQGNGIAVDSAGNAYIAGQTESAAFGFTPTGTFQTAFNGQGDAFVAKLSTTGALSYFTYLGGTKADAATGIAVDSLDDVYVTGSTVSTDFPTSGAVFQPTYGGGNADSFVAKLDSAGATLVYSSFLGGTNTELATGIAVDTAGSAYVTGQTCSQDFPLANPLQSNPGGNCDAYVAKVTILAGLALNPAGLVFSAQSLNTTSQTQTVTLTNGDNSQNISGIAVSGTNASEFAETNTCPASLNVGATCTITVSFTPTTIGIAKASLTLTDSAIGSPQVVNLTGTTSTVLLSASSLSFGSVAEGATSPAQTITVTNGSNNTTLTISNIAASGGFAESDNCAVSLAPFDNCVINVIYKPLAAGQSIGTLSITDFSTTSAGVSQAPAVQPVQLTGIGTVPSFTIQPVASSPPVPAGQTASYILSINPDPSFSGQVTLGCIGLPHGATCAASSNPVALTGGKAVQVQILITTAVRTMAPPVSGIKTNPGSFDGLTHFSKWLTLLVALLIVATLAGFKRRPAMAGFGLVAILLVVLVGCSAGSSSGVPAGTPAGTYQISVTGTSGSSPQQVANLTLQVK